MLEGLTAGQIAPDQASRRYGASTTSVSGARGTCEGAKEAVMGDIAPDHSPDGRTGHPSRPSTSFSDHSFGGRKSRESEAACVVVGSAALKAEARRVRMRNLYESRSSLAGTVNFSAASSQ